MVKKVLFDHAQNMGYRLPEPEPMLTMARGRAGMEFGGKSKTNPSVQEKTDGIPSEHEYLTKLWPNIFNGVKFSGNLKG